MKPATQAPLRSTRLLDQLRERIRYAHYSLRTEQASVYWVRCFIRHHRLRHPREMGGAEVAAFLTHLASARGVSPSTQSHEICSRQDLPAPRRHEVHRVHEPEGSQKGDTGSKTTLCIHLC